MNRRIECEASPGSAAESIIRDLMRPSACIHPKYFYDATGSGLFDAITRLPEYYLTRVEQEIFQLYHAEIAREIGHGMTMIEPGAGNCRKAAEMCRLVAPREVVVIDISAECLEEGVMQLQAEFPRTKVHAVAADFTTRFELPPDVAPNRRLLFFPGSSIGNFDRDEAMSLLLRFRDLIDDDGALLIGVDLHKNTDELESAYNDADGTTAAFNRNVLSHINRHVGGNFVPEQWVHRAFYNVAASRIEMHLEASSFIDARWMGGGRRFHAGERIHTENSYKYRPEAFCDLLASVGLPHVTWWTDSKVRFGIFLARP